MPRNKLVLEGDIFPSLNRIIDLSKQHWSKYAKLKKEMTSLVMWQAKRQCKPVKAYRYPVMIKISWAMPSARRDPDNIAHAKKYILDGLVKAKILEGDGFKQIKEFRDMFSVDKENPRVEVYF